MKNMRRVRITTISIVLVLCGPLWAERQEKTAEKPAAASVAPAVKPGAAEMDRLKFYLGEWEYTETYPKSGFSPNGGKNADVYTSKLGPGGNSLINTFPSQGSVGDFEGLLVMTWDAREKAYKAYAFGNDFPGALVETGQFEGDELVYRSEFPVEGATLKLRNVTRITGNACERRIHDHERRAGKVVRARGSQETIAVAAAYGVAPAPLSLKLS
ncbi:MAG TPA: hypothetical protein VF394_07720 [Candidatus Acidoferrum sp.]